MDSMNRYSSVRCSDNQNFSASAAVQKSTCEVCHENISEYKCPSCSISFCSSSCYKIHKENGCKESSQGEVTKEFVHMEKNKLLMTNHTEMMTEKKRVPLEEDVLKELTSSNEIKGKLVDPIFRGFLYELSTSEYAEARLLEAFNKDTHGFQGFATEILGILNSSKEHE